MAQAWPPSLRRDLPKLTQEEFDDAVRTNIEDFDMEPDEAVRSAVEEFTLQNYDMGCVVKTAAGKELASHPVVLATQAISAATNSSDASSVAQQCSDAYAQLQACIDAAVAKGAEGMQELSAVALRAGALGVVLRSIKHLAGMDEGGAAIADTAAYKVPLGLARQLAAASLDVRDTFDDVQGPQLLMHLHKQHLDDLALQVEIAGLAECVCFKEEQNKEQLMELGYALGMLELLQRDPGSLTEEVVASASGVLRAICTADDDRPPVSKAFMNARLLAHDHKALQTLLALLKGIMAGWGAAVPPACTPKPSTIPSTPGTSAPTVSAVLGCVRQLAANDEICRSFSDEGGVLTCLALVKQLQGKHREVVRAGLGALRQLANNDDTKCLLAAHDAPGVLLPCASSYPGDEDVIEPVLGVLSAITLRQPEICLQFAEAGVVEWVIECLTDLAKSPLVCRQACIVLRNMVVRTPELRPAYLEKGAEALVRAAKAAHPRNCKDVGYAALRDLGLDNYND